jgi:hypothetical protein
MKAKKPLTFSEMLQRQIDKQNKRAAESKAAMNRLLAQYQASKPKQPWEMTAAEYRSEQNKGRPEYQLRNSAVLADDFDRHDEMVQGAIREGLKVPQYVLDDYNNRRSIPIHTDDSGSFECPLGSACDEVSNVPPKE